MIFYSTILAYKSVCSTLFLNLFDIIDAEPLAMCGNIPMTNQILPVPVAVFDGFPGDPK